MVNKKQAMGIPEVRVGEEARTGGVNGVRMVLATYGTRGDVEPIAALGVELQARGAEVVVCAPPDAEFAELLARAGLRTAPFLRSWSSWATEETNAEERVPSVDDFVNEYIAATYEPLAAATQGADVLLASGMLHFVARTAADVAGIPQRFVVFSPDLLEPQPWQAMVGPPLDAHRASLGLPPCGDVHEHLFTATPWVSADPVLSPTTKTSATRTAAWVLKDSRPLPSELVEFLDAGEPPIYVGFGSMRVQQEDATAAIEAARSVGRRVVLARGWAGLDLVDDEPDCFSVGEINQQALFQRVAAVVHHGGAGTTATAARAGAPQVVVPQTADQPHWAARVSELGIGVAHDGPKPTLASVAEALEMALDPATCARASAVADAMPADGAAVAAERLLAVIGRTP